MRQEIETSYDPGSRYRSVRSLADHFNVSVQTAHRAIRQLTNDGILESRDRRGSYVLRKPGQIDIRGRTIILISNNPDTRFTEAFLSGITSAAKEESVRVVSHINTRPVTDTLDFGEYIERLCRDNESETLITLAFRSCELALYHLVTRGIIVASDIEYDRVPVIASVQSDNRRHCQEAARRLKVLGKTNILVAGFWPPGNVRLRSFEDEFRKLLPSVRIKHVMLTEETSQAELYLFFRHFTKSSAAFSTDYAANHVIAPFFLYNDIDPSDAFVVYDSEYEYFRFGELPPVTAAAPALSIIGKSITEKVIHRMKYSEWKRPIRERI